MCESTCLKSQHSGSRERQTDFCWVLGQPGVHSETFFQTTTKKYFTHTHQTISQEIWKANICKFLNVNGDTGKEYTDKREFNEQKRTQHLKPDN